MSWLISYLWWWAVQTSGEGQVILDFGMASIQTDKQTDWPTMGNKAVP